MIAVARRINPGLECQVGDMHAVDVSPAASCCSTPSSIGLEATFPRCCANCDVSCGRTGCCWRRSTWRRDHGVDDLFGAPVILTVYFHRPAVVVAALEAAGFAVIEQTEREPYAGAEYPTRRGYLLARAVSARRTRRARLSDMDTLSQGAVVNIESRFWRRERPSRGA